MQKWCKNGIHKKTSCNCLDLFTVKILLIVWIDLYAMKMNKYLHWDNKHSILFRVFSVVFCPPVPAWSETEFNSSINEFESVVMYWCKNLYQFKTCDPTDSNYEGCQRVSVPVTYSRQVLSRLSIITIIAIQMDHNNRYRRHFE